MASIQRRQLVKGSLWAVPAVAVASAVPAYAVSECNPWPKYTIQTMGSTRTGDKSKASTFAFDVVADLTADEDKPDSPCAEGTVDVLNATFQVLRTGGLATRNRTMSLSTGVFPNQLTVDGSKNAPHNKGQLEWEWTFQVDPELLWNQPNHSVHVVLTMGDGGTPNPVINSVQFNSDDASDSVSGGQVGL